MIVKGRARKDGLQLATYFMESEGGARLLFVSDPAGDIHAAMTEWDEIGQLTRGEQPIYHMQLCPDAKYTVTDEQWRRMAEITLEDLGLKGHDYALVVHPGAKDNGEQDKPHAHLAVCRTNRDTLTMWDTSKNYEKHERASLRIAKEYAWEIVPGKHAKRDREKQPEFPRQEMTTAEAQQEKRTGLSVAERKAEIAQLYGQSHTGQSFKNSLEAAGYVLAQGDRGYLIVDEAGGHSVLTRNVKGLKKTEADAFMQDVPLAKLPTLEEAKSLQQERAVNAKKQAQEASKFLPVEGPSAVEKTPEPPPPSQFLPPKQEPAPYDWALYAPKPPVKQPEAPTPAADQISKFLPPAVPPAAPEQPKPPFHVPQPGPDWTEQEVTSKFNATQPEPPAAPKPPWEDPELRKLRKDIFERQQAEYQKFADANAAAYRARGKLLKDAMRWKMEDFDHGQAEARQALVLRQTRKRKGVRGLLDAVAKKLNPEAAEEKAAAQKEDRSRLRQRQLGERIDYMKRLDLDKAAELQALRATHLQEQAAREKTYDDEIARHVAELLEARKIAAALEAEEKLKKENDLAREQSGWAEDFKKEQEYPWEDEPPQKGK